MFNHSLLFVTYHPVLEDMDHMGMAGEASPTQDLVEDRMKNDLSHIETIARSSRVLFSAAAVCRKGSMC